jgi:hypothetical protein
MFRSHKDHHQVVELNEATLTNVSTSPSLHQKNPYLANIAFNIQFYIYIHTHTHLHYSYNNTTYTGNNTPDSIWHYNPIRKYVTYCGVSMPCKNHNIKTHSRDYETIDEAVFSLCQTQESRAMTSHIALPHLLPGNSYKHLDYAGGRKGHHVSSDTTIKVFSRKSDQGFIGVLYGRQPWKIRS